MKKKCLKTAQVNVIIALNVTGAEKQLVNEVAI